jgi:predicted AAA+ superfamily ATPase
MPISIHYQRRLLLSKLVEKNSYFLFGPRATGKTSLVHAQLPKAQVFDLLDDDVYDEFLRRPKALEEQIRDTSQIVVIDEIQKLPKLLDEVHRLMERQKIRFLLTGSSARKLKRSGANMLGGRAREAHLFPLTFAEISAFNLMKFLNYGGLPIIYRSDDPMEDLKAYVRVYLNEEIKAEAAVRNYERFVCFLETMALSNGQEINYQTLSSQSGVPARTLEGHIEVLKDTLIGFELSSFQKSIKRKAVSKSKFYFFDTGVANFLSQKLPLRESHSDTGFSFEQFLIQEVRAFLSYKRLNLPLSYWRSRDKEVDLIIGDRLAIEFKFSAKLNDKFFSGLKTLRDEKLIEDYLLVSRSKKEGIHDGIKYMFYETFLSNLWSEQLL